jgi:hypothetical protein
MAVRGNAEHEAAMAANGISEIDLVIINLYAFDATVAKGSNFEARDYPAGGHYHPVVELKERATHPLIGSLLYCWRLTALNLVEAPRLIGGTVNRATDSRQPEVPPPCLARRASRT